MTQLYGVTCLILVSLSTPLGLRGQQADTSSLTDPVEPLSSTIARGDSLHAILDPLAAFKVFRRSADVHPDSYEVLWRAAKEAVYLGMIEEEVSGDEGEVPETAVDWYLAAEEYARRSLEVDSTRAEGYHWLSVSLGRQAMTHGSKTRLRFAKQIRDAAETALEIDPMNAGAHNVLGQWNTNLVEVSGFSRWFAKGFLGGEVLDEASWEAATDHLRRAVELEPESIIHRLELGKLYLKMEWFEWAQVTLEEALRLPVLEPTDKYQLEEAEELLAELAASFPTSTVRLEAPDPFAPSHLQRSHPSAPLRFPVDHPPPS